MSTQVLYEGEVPDHGGSAHLFLQIAENDGSVGIGLAVDEGGKDLRMCSLPLVQAKEVLRALTEAITRAGAT